MNRHSALLLAAFSLRGIQPTWAQIAGLNGAACEFATITQAVAAADDGDVIRIEPGVYLERPGAITASISIEPALAGSNCTASDPAASADGLIINGNGATANSAGGLLSVTDGAQVVIRRATLGFASADQGGIIAVLNGATLRLERVSVIGGVANESGGLAYIAGGAAASRLELVDGSSLFDGFTSGAGGAVSMVGGELLLSSSLVGSTGAGLANRADGHGGAIFARSSLITIDGASTLVGNSAALSGGAIFADSSILTLADAEIRSNTAGGSGGGIFLNDLLNVLTMTGCELSGNQASNGGAIAGGGELTVSQSTFEENLVSGVGGGIHCNFCNALTVNRGTRFEENEAGSGGGIYVASDVPTEVELTDVTFEANQASGEVSEGLGDGGGFYAAAGTVEIGNSQFAANAARAEGGGLYMRDVGSLPRDLTLQSSSLTGNRAENGGALSLRDLELVRVSGGEWSNNQALALGGGAQILGVADFSASDILIAENRAEVGAGVYASGAEEFSLTRTAINLNEADNQGGGVYLASVEFAGLVDSQIVGNSAQNGGGVLIRFSAGSFSNGQITDNVASENGGGVYVDGAELSLAATTTCNSLNLAPDNFCLAIDNNLAAEYGGGVYVQNPGSPVDSAPGTFISGAAIRGNNAGIGGTAIHLRQSMAEVYLENSLVTGNGNGLNTAAAIEVLGDSTLSISSTTAADNFNAAIDIPVADAQFAIANSIVYHNGDGPLVVDGVLTCDVCNHVEPTAAGGVTFGQDLGDPVFDMAAARGAFYLSAASPGVDACLTGPLRDMEFRYRPDPGGSYDQGPFERAGVTTDPGVEVVTGAELSTTESGGTASVALVLTSPPLTRVVIPVSSSVPTEGRVVIDQVDFLPTNWFKPRLLLIEGVDDDLADGDQPFQIRLGPTLSDDMRYDGLDPEDVNLINLDDEPRPELIFADSFE
ncbi:MAG: right-handed parallel beta-helix repeat-containing protein [Pseudomonadota bacterium]